MNENKEIVRVYRVKKQYSLGEHTVNALRGVSFSIPPETFCAIAGPSGSGKSTLLNIIGLLDKADRGEVYLEGMNTSQLNSRKAARIRYSRVGFVFQDFNLIPVLTAFENVELPMRVGSSLQNKNARQKWVMSLLDEVGLADHAKHKPSQLSGGQQQRVAIARALVNRPAIILADEPTANLDSETGREILETMQRFNREFKTTFIFSTHDTVIHKMAEIIIPLRDGLVND